ncbi:MAG: hypothetical protein DIZ78_06490 [endosymbiont of Escarpia spicata]|uniref:Uncharacterized protein n=1 Tax=endosymbiont of Escarpia spicata TaxID=2200908 RepID=A0A370DPR5_9GAMM|nr:MAG: hypothetical protein DIZ78_06490 [endosymbiont of Escarpia spicata]
MSEILIWTGLTVFVFVFIAWIVWNIQPERVACTSQTLIKKYKGKTESIELVDIDEIKYHYHAAAGFLSEWEFIDRNGGSLKIDGESKGIEQVLSQLESILPSFSLDDFKIMFKAGDVEDSLNVWKNA